MAKKVNIKVAYLLILIIIILSIAIVYLYFIKPTETAVVITSPDKAAEIQKDIGSSVSDIKSDLEQLKKSLGK